MSEVSKTKLEAEKCAVQPEGQLEPGATWCSVMIILGTMHDICDMRCSLKGSWSRALQVRQRMVRRGMQPTVHVYNALLAACERACQW